MRTKKCVVCGRQHDVGMYLCKLCHASWRKAVPDDGNGGGNAMASLLWAARRARRFVPRLQKDLWEAEARLTRIKYIIESVDARAAACDGPVTPTLQEMRQSEISEIYKLAKVPAAKTRKRK